MYREPDPPAPIEAHVWNETPPGAFGRDLGAVALAVAAGLGAGGVLHAVEPGFLPLLGGVLVGSGVVALAHRWSARRRLAARVEEPSVRLTGPALEVPGAGLFRFAATIDGVALWEPDASEGMLRFEVDELHAERRWVPVRVMSRHVTRLPGLRLEDGASGEVLWLLARSDAARGLEHARWAPVEEASPAEGERVVQLWPDQLERLAERLLEGALAAAPVRARVAVADGRGEAEAVGVAEDLAVAASTAEDAPET